MIRIVPKLQKKKKTNFNKNINPNIKANMNCCDPLVHELH